MMIKRVINNKRKSYLLMFKNIYIFISH